jgi:hypothetical protein
MFECFWRGYDQIRPSAIVSAGFMVGRQELCCRLPRFNSLTRRLFVSGSHVGCMSADIRLLPFGVLHLIRSKTAIVIRMRAKSSLATIALDSFRKPLERQRTITQMRNNNLGYFGVKRDHLPLSEPLEGKYTFSTLEIVNSRPSTSTWCFFWASKQEPWRGKPVLLQWLVLQALRCVQWDLSSKELRKRIPVWIHLLDVIGVGISFLPS